MSSTKVSLSDVSIALYALESEVGKLACEIAEKEKELRRLKREKDQLVITIMVMKGTKVGNYDE